jgi:hypothetical protein
MMEESGVSLKFESRNPPISLRHANSLSTKNFSAYISLFPFFNNYVTNLNSHKIQIGNNIDEILYYHDGINMKELLSVSRIIYPLLKKANHMKVEAHMAPPLPLTSLSIDPQNPIYKI